MSQDIRDFLTPSCELLAFGEPTHQEPAFGRVRNELFAQLAEAGFRSIAMETDRVGGLAVNDFVQGGAGTLDVAMKGFSHDFGELEANRELIAWMREYNQDRPPSERLAFHGFDAPTETMSAPSPRTYLEHARDYLGLDIELDFGDDDRWGRTEAIMDAAMSIGNTSEAARLRSIGEDLLTALYARAPELIASTSRAEWFRAKTHLTAGLDLLGYHKQAAERLETGERVTRLLAVRGAIMAQNVLDIRLIENRRGATMLFAANGHLQRSASSWRFADRELHWFSAGAILTSIVDEKYVFVLGSLGRSEALGLPAPEPDTYEGALQGSGWHLTPAADVAPGRTRTGFDPMTGYAPLAQSLIDSADAVLHIS